MAEQLTKIINFYDKIAPHVPLMFKAKHFVCYLRWQLYKFKVRKYTGLANQIDFNANILILMDAGIGNGVEATPLVQAIRNCFPKVQITIKHCAGDLFDNWSAVNNITDSNDFLKGQHFDHTFVAWGGAVSRCKGICDLGMIHYTEEGLGKRCIKSEREYNMDILRRIGYSGPTPGKYISQLKPSIQVYIPQGMKFCLVPGAKNTGQWKNKRWPYYEQLGKLILNNYKDSTIYLIGTREDYVSQDFLRFKNVIDLRSKLSLSETAWFFSKTDLVIGNDCGPMHIADAVNVPSFVIFGPTCAIKNAPSYKFSKSIKLNLNCSPCQYDKNLFKCNNPKCMSDLSPELVFDEIKKSFRN